MRILYESDLAGSKYHGMAYRIFQFSLEFKKRGHDVIIIAASFSHARRINPIVKNMITDDEVDGIKYRWIKTPKYRGNGIGRVLHMLIYNFRLWYYADRIAKEFKPDLVIASGVTPLDFIGCRRIARKAKTKILLEVGDLWPLTPVELGNFSPKHPFIIFLQAIENFAYKKTDGVISLLPCAKDYMISHNLVPEKFNYIPNGVVVEDWKNNIQIPKQHMDTILKLRNDGKFIVGFAGTHSLSNALDTLLDVSLELINSKIVFILVGDGPEKNNLIKTAIEKCISNIFFLPSIHKETIPSFLMQMDALYVGFKKSSLYRFGISPNKIFDYMMAGKPVIQAIEAGNNLVREAECGEYAEPDNVQKIVTAVLKISNLSLDERKRLGNNGKTFVLANHSYSILTDKYLKVIEEVTCKKKDDQKYIV